MPTGTDISGIAVVTKGDYNSTFLAGGPGVYYVALCKDAAGLNWIAKIDNNADSATGRTYIYYTNSGALAAPKNPRSFIYGGADTAATDDIRIWAVGFLSGKGCYFLYTEGFGQSTVPWVVKLYKATPTTGVSLIATIEETGVLEWQASSASADGLYSNPSGLAWSLADDSLFFLAVKREGGQDAYALVKVSVSDGSIATDYPVSLTGAGKTLVGPAEAGEQPLLLVGPNARYYANFYTGAIEGNNLVSFTVDGATVNDFTVVVSKASMDALVTAGELAAWDFTQAAFDVNEVGDVLLVVETGYCIYYDASEDELTVLSGYRKDNADLFSPSSAYTNGLWDSKSSSAIWRFDSGGIDYWGVGGTMADTSFAAFRIVGMGGATINTVEGLTTLPNTGVSMQEFTPANGDYDGRNLALVIDQKV